MKKFSLLLIAAFSITTAFSQGLSANLGYGMWNGEMTHHADHEGESTNSILIGVNYTHELSEKLDLQGSLSYGIGYGILPLQSSLIYNISEANHFRWLAG